MMDPITDPFLNLYNDGQISSISDSLLLSNVEGLAGFDLDLPIPSPNKFEQETISTVTENPGTMTKSNLLFFYSNYLLCFFLFCRI